MLDYAEIQLCGFVLPILWCQVVTCMYSDDNEGCGHAVNTSLDIGGHSTEATRCITWSIISLLSRSTLKGSCLKQFANKLGEGVIYGEMGVANIKWA